MPTLVTGSRGRNVERWTTTAAELDGGATLPITTAIRAKATVVGGVLTTTPDLEFVKVDVYPNYADSTAIGSPVLTKPTVAIVGGVFVVTLGNTAPPGNRVPCEVEIRRDHSEVR